jgi:hypothetical protein
MKLCNKATKMFHKTTSICEKPYLAVNLKCAKGVEKKCYFTCRLAGIPDGSCKQKCSKNGRCKFIADTQRFLCNKIKPSTTCDKIYFSTMTVCPGVSLVDRCVSFFRGVGHGLSEEAAEEKCQIFKCLANKKKEEDEKKNDKKEDEDETVLSKSTEGLLDCQCGPACEKLKKTIRALSKIKNAFEVSDKLTNEEKEEEATKPRKPAKKPYKRTTRSAWSKVKKPNAKKCPRDFKSFGPTACRRLYKKYFYKVVTIPQKVKVIQHFRKPYRTKVRVCKRYKGHTMCKKQWIWRSHFVHRSVWNTRFIKKRFRAFHWAYQYTHKK